jgi:glycosyltransferase involved in cell wall biosynthesis
MNLVIERPVTVITPTIGSPKLKDAIESVKNQTYKCKHLLVIDGTENAHKVYSNAIIHDDVKVVHTPENTGKTGGNFYGHRVYAAYPHLVNSDYILFLDEDNWYEPDHVESLVSLAEKKNLDFTYSLRKIFSAEGKYLTDDNCESLGKWPIYFTRNHENGEHHLIDTSSFCFTREFIEQTCHLWHSGWGGDRRYFYAVRDHADYDTSGKHTLCYRLDGNPNSVNKEFFDEGNKVQHEFYGEDFPWVRT